MQEPEKEDKPAVKGAREDLLPWGAQHEKMEPVDPEVAKDVITKAQTASIPKADIEGELHAYKAVSYTHLDVYKRQVFTRGQTQVMTILTLGSMSEVQSLDGLSPEHCKRYMHQYNMPPYSVGETRMMLSLIHI